MYFLKFSAGQCPCTAGAMAHITQDFVRRLAECPCRLTGTWLRVIVCLAFLITPLLAQDFGTSPIWAMRGGDERRNGVSALSPPPAAATLRWQFFTGGTVMATPVISSNGTVIVGSLDGRLYALRYNDGALLWAYSAGAPIRSAAAIGVAGSAGTAPEKVYVAAGTALHCVDAYSGTFLWQVALGSITGSAPALTADGAVAHVGTANAFVAVDLAARSLLWSTRSVAGDAALSQPVLVNTSVGTLVVHNVSAPAALVALSASTGAAVWRFNSSYNYISNGAATTMPGTGWPALAIVDSSTVRMLNASNAVSLWGTPLTNTVVGTPAVANGSVYVYTYSNNLQRLNMSTGRVDWLWNGDGGAWGHGEPPLLTQSGLALVAIRGRVSAIEVATGRRRWAIDTGTTGPSSSPTLSVNGFIFMGSEEGTIFGIAGCSAGYFADSIKPGGACTPCAAGSYSESSDAATCTLCPAGTMSSSLAASSASLCRPCSPGSFAPQPGSSWCVPCGAGYYGAEFGAASAAACICCPAGSFGPFAGASVCSLCPRGTWSSALNATARSACVNCPAGTTTFSAGASDPSDCVPVEITGASPSSTAAATPSGTALPTPSRGASASASPCPAGGVCPLLFSGNAAPVMPCPASFWCRAGERNVTHGSGLCDATRYCPENSTSSRGAGPCREGYWCPGGSASSDGSPTGGICPGGYYCPLGSALPIAGSAGIVYPPGSATVFGGPAGGPAPAGRYAGLLAEVSLPCAPGSFAPRPGMASCLPCPANTYNSRLGADAASACTACPNNGVSPPGSVSSGDCIEPSPSPPPPSPSPSMMPSPSAGASASPSPCPAGLLCSVTAAGAAATPQACPAGKYCSGGSYGNVTGDCAQGYFCPSGSHSAAGEPRGGRCRAGFWCPGGSASYDGSPTGGICPGGYHCPSGSSFPIAGSPGFTYAPGSADAFGSGPAPAGRYAGAAAESATYCGPGTYAPRPGMAACLLCPVGRFAPGLGGDSLASCLTCPTGRTTAGEGASGPSACIAGDLCAPGFESRVAGSTNPADCVRITCAGGLVLSPDNSSCIGCAAGLFGTPPNCVSCPSGGDLACPGLLSAPVPAPARLRSLLSAGSSSGLADTLGRLRNMVSPSPQARVAAAGSASSSNGAAARLLQTGTTAATTGSGGGATAAAGASSNAALAAECEQVLSLASLASSANGAGFLSDGSSSSGAGGSGSSNGGSANAAGGGDPFADALSGASPLLWQMGAALGTSICVALVSLAALAMLAPAPANSQSATSATGASAGKALQPLSASASAAASAAGKPRRCRRLTAACQASDAYSLLHRVLEGSSPVKRATVLGGTCTWLGTLTVLNAMAALVLQRAQPGANVVSTTTLAGLDDAVTEAAMARATQAALTGSNAALASSLFPAAAGSFRLDVVAASDGVASCSSLFSWSATGLLAGNFTSLGSRACGSGIALHSFACADCVTGTEAGLQLSLPWACQSVALRLLTVTAAAEARMTTAVPPAPSSSSASSSDMLSSLKWTVPLMLTLQTDRTRMPTQHSRGYTPVQASLSATYQAASAELRQPSTAALLLQIAFPPVSFFQLVTLSEKVSLLQLLASLSGVAGLLAAFGTLFVASEAAKAMCCGEGDTDAAAKDKKNKAGGGCHCCKRQRVPPLSAAGHGGASLAGSAVVAIASGASAGGSRSVETARLVAAMPQHANPLARTVSANAPPSVAAAPGAGSLASVSRRAVQLADDDGAPDTFGDGSGGSSDSSDAEAISEAAKEQRRRRLRGKGRGDGSAASVSTRQVARLSRSNSGSKLTFSATGTDAAASH